MSIRVICDKCDNELHEPGGLVFTKPDAHGNNTKYHLCVACEILLMDWLTER